MTSSFSDSRIDIETCSACIGQVKVIAFVEDQVVIEKILGHRSEKAVVSVTNLLSEDRVPTPASLFG